MNIERKSSGTAKAGLATGIVGTSLGALNALGGGMSLLGGLGNGVVRNVACGCSCSEDHLVDRYTLAQESKISELETQIALRDANIFTDQKFVELYKYIDSELRDIRGELGRQAVHNQKTEDSFQIVSERMQCCCDSLEAKINTERKERRCADNTIINYTNATFYPKQIADVTTGTTTTAQVLYNPLPVNTCDCDC